MPTTRARCWLAIVLCLVARLAAAQVTSDRLQRAADEPQNWLTYSGGYVSQRYSLLRPDRSGNAKNLELKWCCRTRRSVPGRPRRSSPTASCT